MLKNYLVANYFGKHFSPFTYLMLQSYLKYIYQIWSCYKILILIDEGKQNNVKMCSCDCHCGSAQQHSWKSAFLNSTQLVLAQGQCRACFALCLATAAAQGLGLTLGSRS